MSTEPTTPEPKPTDTRPPTETEIAARGRTDPWAGDAAAAGNLGVAERAPRQFDPACRKRLRNLMDEENAYCN